jgi:hypothetical protein
MSHKVYRREGCICTGEWPKFGEPVTRDEGPRNRTERRQGIHTVTTSRFHIHSPECDAAWQQAHKSNAA